MSLVLVGATLATYAGLGRHPFIPFDDPQYVVENPHVATGLAWDNVRWAFRSGEQGNWHPLTWISHMTDVELFGLDAGAHHLTNVALHALNGVLLLWLLAAITGARWSSALVAALFALHPLHVESVAWIAERKDVLSACFWWAALLAYAWYVRRPGLARYIVVIALFAAGLMSKPMVVTLPFVMLLLDRWPLDRAAGDIAAWRRLVIEKLPLVALSLASSAVTFVVQQRGGAVRSLEALPVARRIGTALTGYVTYLVQLVWPRDLAVLYPFPQSLPVWQPAVATLVLAAITYVAVRRRRERPWVLVGWFWFLGTLVPVIGLVQVGSQPVADRYTYIPYTGVFIALAWSAREIAARVPALRRLVVAVALAALTLLAFLTREQVTYWRDGVTLWTHALAVTDRNYRAHSALGVALESAGREDEAIDQYAAALAIRPTYVEALNNLAAIRLARGDLASASDLLSRSLAVAPDHVESLANLAVIRTRENRIDDALRLFERAKALQPESAAVRNGLGFALSLAGRLDDARAELEAAARLTPDDPEIHANLGLVFADMGQSDNALASFRRAIAIAPNHARSHYGVGSVLFSLGRASEAETELSRAVSLDPALADAHHERGRVLVSLGRIAEALTALDTAARLAPGNPDVHYDLAVVLLKLDRRADAVRQLQEAIRLDPNHLEAAAALRALGRSR